MGGAWDFVIDARSLIMVQSKAKTVVQYLQELEPERRAVVERVREVVLENIQEGFDEVMNWGMITYEVPLSRFAKTYNRKPLMFCSLAAQKHHYAVYLMSIYSGATDLKVLEEGYAAAGVKLDMGKCCVRFKRLDGRLGIDLPTIGKIVGASSVDDVIATYRAVRGEEA